MDWDILKAAVEGCFQVEDDSDEAYATHCVSDHNLKVSRLASARFALAGKAIREAQRALDDAEEACDSFPREEGMGHVAWGGLCDALEAAEAAHRAALATWDALEAAGGR